MDWTSFLEQIQPALASYNMCCHQMHGVGKEGSSASCRDTWWLLGVPWRRLAQSSWAVHGLLTDFNFMQALYVVTPPRVRMEGAEKASPGDRGVLS